MVRTLRWVLALLAAGFLTSACAGRWEGWGPETKKPMFVGMPAIEKLRPEARARFAKDVPAPNFKTAQYVWQEGLNGAVYGRSDFEIVTAREGYAEIRDSQRFNFRCSFWINEQRVLVAGVMDQMVSRAIGGASCGPGGVGYFDWEIAEITNVEGELFPLRLGNRLAYTQRELASAGNASQSTGPFGMTIDQSTPVGTGFSERERISTVTVEVVERISDFYSIGGKRIGEVFVLRRTSKSPSETDVSELHYSTVLNWPVMHHHGKNDVTWMQEWR